MAATLGIDVLAGVPQPTRGRWEPVRAGILNLFRYDEQTFAFHRGRLLIRGNNGTGKSMALEVLLPFVLDADMTPYRLSTFGGRDRNMYLWLIGFDKTGRRGSERAYVWVEFGRRLLDGASEFFTAGAMVEGTRDGEVKANYFTTAARLGIDLFVGRPGSEPLNKNLLIAALEEQSVLGRPGRVHDDAKGHRKAVNDALYRLPDRTFDALRGTLRQLRRPKLSDKLDEAGLNVILRDSLPTIADATVADLAEGFERLDRHAQAVQELEETMRHLGVLRDAYRRYARVAGAARADAVAAAETAIGQVRDRAIAARVTSDAAQVALEKIAERRTLIGIRLAEIDGRFDVLRDLDAYKVGRDLAPLHELVSSLSDSLRMAKERHDREAGTANRDAVNAERTASEAAAGRDMLAAAREIAAVQALSAHAVGIDAHAVGALAELLEREVTDEGQLKALIDETRRLIDTMNAELTAWNHQIAGLRKLNGQVQERIAAASVADAETRRADADVNVSEAKLNDCLEDDRVRTVEWLDRLTDWSSEAVQLCAGQAPPLPWEAATASVRAGRWAEEASTARNLMLFNTHDRFTENAGQHALAAIAARRADTDLKALADLVDGAAKLAAIHRSSLLVYRDTVVEWTARMPSSSFPDPHRLGTTFLLSRYPRPPTRGPTCCICPFPHPHRRTGSSAARPRNAPGTNR